MKITDILKTTNIFLDVPSSSKKQILEKIAEHVASIAKCEEQVIFDALVERERLGTTGVGKGIAIPHARLAGLSDLFCMFMRVEPVDFEAIDAKPVDLIFCLLVPEESGADHLKALAHISKLLRDENAVSALRKAKNANEVLEVISSADIED